MYSSPDGATTLTASLTTGEAEFDFAQVGELFAKAQQLLGNEVFSGGRSGSGRPTH